MKNSIIFFLIGLLTFNELYSQDKIPFEEIEIDGVPNYFYKGENLRLVQKLNSKL